MQALYACVTHSCCHNPWIRNTRRDVKTDSTACIQFIGESPERGKERLYPPLFCEKGVTIVVPPCGGVNKILGWLYTTHIINRLACSIIAYVFVVEISGARAESGRF